MEAGYNYDSEADERYLEERRKKHKTDKEFQKKRIKQYAQDLMAEAPIYNDQEKAPLFQPAPNIQLSDQQKQIAAKYLGLVHEAIQKGDGSTMDFYLGPPLYKELQLFSQHANQLRWSWLEARTKLDMYQHAIKIIILHARKVHCDLYIQQYLEDELAYFSRPAQAETEHLRYVADRYPDILKKYEQYGLLAYTAIMESEPYATVFRNSYTDVETIPPIETSDFFQLWKLKRFVKASLHQLPKETMKHTLEKFTETYQLAVAEKKAGEEKESLILLRNSEGTVLTAIPAHTLSIIETQTQALAFKNPLMLKSVKDEIDVIFSSVDNLFDLLIMFYEERDKYNTQCENLSVEYSQFIANYQEKSQKLIAEFKETAQPQRKQQIEEILSSRIGVVSLGSEQMTYTYQDGNTAEVKQGAKDLLTIAFEQYHEEEIKNKDSKDEINEKYLPIIVSLIERGCSPFKLKLPENHNLPIFNNNSWHWQILIAALDIMNCITPFAEEVRKILLDYSKKVAQEKRGEGSNDLIGQARCSAVTRLTKALHESQQPDTFQEAKLIAEIRRQIAPGVEPRGLLGRSTLYTELGKLIARADSKAVITISGMFKPASRSQMGIGVEGNHALAPRLLRQ